MLNEDGKKAGSTQSSSRTSIYSSSSQHHNTQNMKMQQRTETKYEPIDRLPQTAHPPADMSPKETNVPHPPDYTRVSPAKAALRRHLSQEKIPPGPYTKSINDVISNEVDRTFEITSQNIINAAVDMSYDKSKKESEKAPPLLREGYSPISRPSSVEESPSNPQFLLRKQYENYNYNRSEDSEQHGLEARLAASMYNNPNKHNPNPSPRSRYSYMDVKSELRSPNTGFYPQNREAKNVDYPVEGLAAFLQDRLHGTHPPTSAPHQLDDSNVLSPPEVDMRRSLDSDGQKTSFNSTNQSTNKNSQNLAQGLDNSITIKVEKEDFVDEPKKASGSFTEPSPKFNPAQKIKVEVGEGSKEKSSNSLLELDLSADRFTHPDGEYRTK